MLRESKITDASIDLITSKEPGNTVKAAFSKKNPDTINLTKNPRTTNTNGNLNIRLENEIFVYKQS